MPGLMLAMGLGSSNSPSADVGRGRLFTGLLAAAVLALFVANLGSVLLQTSAANDVYRAQLSWYETNTGPDDLLVVAGGHTWRGYLRYYLEARTEILEELFWRMEYDAAWETVRRDVGDVQSEGGRVFVTVDALQPEACMAGYRDWNLTEFSAFKEDITPYLHCADQDGVSICEVKRMGAE